jgi:CRISPR-associated endonuclease/helicase Cas3
MSYIAHFRESDHAIHELKDHLTHVAEMSEEYGSVFGLGKLARLIGLLHDMGKYGDAFQDYINTKLKESKNDETKRSDSKKIDHGKIGAIYVYNTFHDRGGSIEKATIEAIAMVICYHHGGLNDYITMDCRIPMLERFKLEEEDNSYYQCVDRFFEDVSSEKEIEYLYSEACNEVRTLTYQIKNNQLSLPFSFHLLIKQIYSILIDCDRYDTYMFMENKFEEPPINLKDLWILYSSRLEHKITEFLAKPTKSPLEERIKKLRLQVSDICFRFAKRERGIYFLTVPTGGGKTLSSLRFALEHAKQKEMKKIIYVLPYTTIIEQNASVVRDILNCDEYLLEHHSNVIQTEHEQYKLLTQRWDCPIIFTTMVQFLNTFFEAGTTSIRRLHQLNHAIIIFDEIQSLPIKCISLFNDTVNYLCRMCNCTIVLSSATQPNLFSTDKPIIPSVDPYIIKYTKDLFHGFKRMNVIPQFLSGGYTIEVLKKFILELASIVKSVLVIMNTKQTVEDLYKALKSYEFEDQTSLYLLSTNLCPAHRKYIIKDIKDKLESRERVICISTQLIEAGVDISFDTVVRSLAGLDSIAQASGRGNRHGEDEIGVTYIVNVQNENLKKLKDIELGQKHTRTILHEYSESPGDFDEDLLSPKAICKYYKYYFSDGEIKNQMDYKIEKYNESIYLMLSGVKKKMVAYKDINGKPFPFQLPYMFKTASNEFKVIDENTRAVLVPFSEGKNIISKLVGDVSLSEKVSCIKEAQQYTVNVFEYQYRRLEAEEALAPSPVEGINILREGFYDDELGVTTEKKMRFLNQ